MSENVLNGASKRQYLGKRNLSCSGKDCMLYWVWAMGLSSSLCHFHLEVWFCLVDDCSQCLSILHLSFCFNCWNLDTSNVAFRCYTSSHVSFNWVEGCTVVTFVSCFAALMRSSAQRGRMVCRWCRILYEAFVESSKILHGIVHTFWLKYLQKHILCSEYTVTHSKS